MCAFNEALERSKEENAQISLKNTELEKQIYKLEQNMKKMKRIQLNLQANSDGKSSEIINLKQSIEDITRKFDDNKLETFKLKQHFEEFKTTHRFSEQIIKEKDVLIEEYKKKDLEITQLKQLIDSLKKSNSFSEQKIKEKEAIIIASEKSIANLVKKVEILY